MSSKNHKPEWHEPVKTVIADLNDPIEDTIEGGEVRLIDGPIDPVPLGTASEKTDYQMPRRSFGPMPDFREGNGMGKDNLKDTVKDTAQTVAQKAQDAAQTAADKVQTIADKAQSIAGNALETAKSTGANSGSLLSNAAGKVGAASASGAQSAGTALWTLIQRNPLQAIVVFASLIWLFRNNSAVASQPAMSLNDAAEKVGSVAGQVQVAAGNLQTQVKQHAQHGAGWFSQTLQEKPLAIGAMAIVFGAALGFAVPETSYEDKLLGKTRDKLADKAQEAAQDLGQKVQTVAQTVVHDAVETVKEEAKNQGLTV